MRRRLVAAPFFTNASVAVALLTSPLAVQATSVKTVFAVENALYGAGYAIGQADGWVDDRLRAAIREYQTDNPKLDTNGELDEPTLSALGIANGQPQLLTENSVASADAARKALGLAAPITKTAAPAPAPAQVAQPTEPVVAAPEPEPQTQPVPALPDKPEPQVVAATIPVSEPVNAQVEPEPTSQPIEIAPTIRANSKGEKLSVSETDDAPVEGSVSIEVVEVGTEERAEAITEAAPVAETDVVKPVQDAIVPDIAEESQPTEKRGNVITKVFGFLFGWLV